MSQAGLATVSTNNLPPSVPLLFTENSGTATPVLNNINILGASAVSGTNPVSTIGLGSNVTVSVQISQAIGASNISNIGLSAFNSSQFSVDANGFVSFLGTGAIETLTGNTGGAISPISNNINIVGAGSITISGAGNTVTTKLSGLNQHSVQVGGPGATLTQISVGTTGQVLQANTAADPTWSTATYPSATVGSGKILYDNGTNFIASTPTFPASASATTRKIIVSDGTNWTASTETYAVPGTSGNVMTSDGTNWTSAAAPGAGLQNVTISLTNAQIKALNTTPITILAAQGSGIIIVPVFVNIKMIYGGTNAFSAGAVQTTICYGTTANTNPTYSFNSQTLWQGTANSYAILSQQVFLTVNYLGTVAENAAISISTNSAITGNAAANNTAKVQMQYYTITL